LEEAQNGKNLVTLVGDIFLDVITMTSLK